MKARPKNSSKKFEFLHSFRNLFGNVVTSSNRWRVVSALGNSQICQLALASVETSAQGGCWKAL